MKSHRAYNRLRIALTASMLVCALGHAETWPEIKTPANATPGVERETEYLYMLGGQIFTVWRAPLTETPAVVLRGRDRAYEDDMYTRWEHGVITPADYAYIRAWMVGVPDQSFGASSIPGGWGGPTPDYELVVMDGTSEFFGVPEQMAQAALLAYLEDPSQLPLNGIEFMEFLGAVGGYIDPDSFAHTQIVALLTPNLPDDVRVALHTGIDWTAVNWSPNGVQASAMYDGLDLSDTNLTGAILNAALISGQYNQSGLVGTNLSGLDLGGLDFAQKNLTGLNLTGATNIDWTSFANAMEISNVDYSFVDLAGLNLAAHSVAGSDFSAATNVPLASIDDPDMRNVSLAGLNVSALNFGGKMLSGANLAGVTVFGGPSLGQRLNTAHTNLSGINLAGTNLTGISYPGRNFSGANFSGASGLNPNGLKVSSVGGLTGAVLTGTGITRAQLAAPPNARPVAELDSITF